VETSRNRWHAYWRVSDCTLADFTPLQKALASRFAGDAIVHDLARVMRLPGFDHRKEDPFRSHLIALCDKAPYALAQFRAAFALDTVVPLPATSAASRTRRKLPDRIPEGERNETLFSLARGFVQKGIDAAGVNQRLQKLNAERCDPPLCATEVDTIAENASGKDASGYAAVPRALAYSPLWKALPDGARTVAVLAYCRDDGSDDCTFALTQSDFASYRDLASNNTVRDGIGALLQSGILVRVSESRNTQTGRKPALYAIASKWKFRQVQNMHLAQSAESARLHRKQCVSALAPDRARNRSKRGKAA